MYYANSRTPSRTSSFATLLPTAAGSGSSAGGLGKAADFGAAHEAFDTAESSMIATINFWFTQTIAIMVYTVVDARPILGSNNKAPRLEFSGDRT